MTLLSAKKFETASMVGAIISKYLHSKTIFVYAKILICYYLYNERVVDRLPLMTYGLNLSLEALILGRHLGCRP